MFIIAMLTCSAEHLGHRVPEMTQSISSFNVLCERSDLPCQVGTVMVGHSSGSHRVTCDTGLNRPCEKYTLGLCVASPLPKPEDSLHKNIAH